MADTETEFGITANGFVLKRLSDIRASMQTRLQNMRDPSSNESLQVDWNEDDPIIQILNAFCDELAACWQLAEQCYNQFNPQLAAGACLSGLVQLNGITRNTGTQSTVTLTFTGDPNIIISKGSQFTDVDNTVTWVTQADVTLYTQSSSTLATGAVIAKSLYNGAFEAAANTITQIVNPQTGLLHVTNLAAAIPGTPDETDASLRIRRARSTETPSRGIAESLYGAISNLEGVTYTRIYCNRSLTTDSNGIPAKSVACVVVGGEDETVAQTIFMHCGIVNSFYGNTTVNYKDSLQTVTSVAFTRPTAVDIVVNVTVKEVEGSTLPIDYDQQIINNIIAYAQGGPSAIGITGGNFDDFGFPPSENVTISRLYIPINAIGGVNIVSMTIGKFGETAGTSDIAIAWNEIAQFTASNIYITRQMT